MQSISPKPDERAAAAARPPVNVAEVIDRSPLGSLQIRVMALCALIILLDGFDVQAIAFTAPAISAEWGLLRERLGPIFSAGLAGMMVGALVVGPIGDRLGRRPALVGSVVTFGAFTLATALATDFWSLLILRFLTGIGLGGALPNATALMTEYAPRRLRNLAVAVIFLGIPLGGVLGGILAAYIVPVFGWESVFVIGGVLPLLLAVPLLLWLPESLRVLALRGASRQAEALRLLARIDPQGSYPAGTALALPESPRGGMPVARLFERGYAADTLKLWVAFFVNLMSVYFLISWIPTLLVQAGFGMANATLASVSMNLGGAVGSFGLAAMVHRLGSRIALPLAMVLAAVCTALIGQLAHSLTLVMVTVFVTGFFIFGAQISMNALAASIYPTDARATGIGWALGMGRTGSILGPVVGGVLVGLALGLPTYFGLFGALLLIAAIALVLIGRHQRRGGEAPPPPPSH